MQHISHLQVLKLASFFQKVTQTVYSTKNQSDCNENLLKLVLWVAQVSVLHWESVT